MILIYLRHHLSFQLLGIFGSISESIAHNCFNYWQKIFREAVPSSLLEQGKKFEEIEEEILENLNEYELLIDGIEQRIERALFYEEQKK